MARSVGRQIGLPIVGLAFHLMIHGTELPEPEEQQGACHSTEDDTRDATPGDGIGAIGVIPTPEKVDWCLRKEEKSGVNFSASAFWSCSWKTGLGPPAREDPQNSRVRLTMGGVWWLVSMYCTGCTVHN
ncbi:hypothetical protein BP00DRAFT_427217 [Aspergillus indologenus CBS 114.80]|uniref:Uncharacterized protein n=1 Tax=Aspergillus indologenus CBS 114.80 TaxID=1450541 RepID=A0A2V5I3Q9_9EURO|nr:hypothetical protein BP00DRAFT_427217 [Aspergillus indologenus CBS 114.80]